jgi:hypothetical protein
MRWFVPLDVIKAKESADVRRELARTRERNRLLEDAIAAMRDANEKHHRAEELLQESHEHRRRSEQRAQDTRVFEESLGRMTIPSNVEDA